jgi:glucose-6-phosphate-specific signal transduction histidine kinase
MIICEKTNDEKQIAHWEQTKWLVLSSLFFFIPSTYAYINKLYLHSILLFFTSLISANYWRKATYSWRRDMDLIFAKISFTVFVSNGILYVRTMSYVLTGYTGMIVLLYCYYLSCRLFELKKDNWYKYHFAFHFIMTCEQTIIIDSILKMRKLLNKKALP